jgi:hypothetical protein
MNKKIVLVLGILVLMTMTVYGGSIYDAQYYDRDRTLFTNNDATRTLNDNSATIDADTLNGQTSTNIINTANTYTDTQVSNEANIRSNADTTLQNNINTEANTRLNADTTLQNNINTEATRRRNADNNLQDNIDDEATRRRNADNMEAFIRGTSDLIEAGIRRNADNHLQDNIDDEASTRETNDNNINTYINNNNALWSQDYSGMSYASMMRFVIGTNWDIMGDYDTFLEYIKSIFATKRELKALQNRIDRLELELKYLEDKYNMPVDKKALNYKYALIVSDDNDMDIETTDGFVCNSNMNACYKLRPLKEETPVIVVDEPVVNNTEYNSKVLAEWQRLCDTGNKMWCDIIENNKDKLN